jgi:hypothetical protein
MEAVTKRRISASAAGNRTRSYSPQFSHYKPTDLSQVLTFKKMAVFWDVASCSLEDIDRRFRAAYCLHHHPGSRFSRRQEDNIKVGIKELVKKWTEFHLAQDSVQQRDYLNTVDEISDSIVQEKFLDQLSNF